MSTTPPPSATPTCARCHQPLDPLASQPSPRGPVHAACATPDDARLPVFIDDGGVRSAPKYGAPPLVRVGTWFTLIGLITALVVGLRRCFF